MLQIFMALTIAGTADALNTVQRVYEKEFKQTLKLGNEMEQALDPVVTDHTYVAPNATTAGVVQPYQTGFTPNLNVSLDAEELTLQPMKVDIEFAPDDLDKFFDSWMAEVDRRGVSRKEYMFPRFLYDEVIMPQIIEDLNVISYSGDFAAPVAGTPGAVITSADGLGTGIADAILAGDITPIVTGALTPSTMVDKVETFADGLPLPYRDAPGEIWMSSTNAKAYWRDYRAQFGTGNSVPGNENNQLRVDGSNMVIRGFSEMEGSDRFIFKPRTGKNLVIGYRRGRPTMPVIRWQEFERTLKGLAEFFRFYGFSYAEATFVSDNA